MARNGLYGAEGKRRQRWRCFPADEKAHNFSGANTARLVLEDPTRCASCEVVRHRYQGPVTPANYRYPIVDVAQA